MIKLSTRSRYGMRLLLHIARHGNDGPIRLSRIAQEMQVSLKYLEQIVMPLKKARYVKTIRGPRGGHALGREPRRIKVGEVVALLEGCRSVAECVENRRRCERWQQCVMRLVWKEASRAFFEKLDSYTLADLLFMEDELWDETRLDAERALERRRRQTAT